MTAYMFPGLWKPWLSLPDGRAVTVCVWSESVDGWHFLVFCQLPFRTDSVEQWD